MFSFPALGRGARLPAPEATVNNVPVMARSAARASTRVATRISDPIPSCGSTSSVRSIPSATVGTIRSRSKWSARVFEKSERGERIVEKGRVVGLERSAEGR